MVWLLVIVGAVLLLVLYFRIRKIPRCGNMVLVTGGVKTGKTTLSVHLAYRTFKRQKLKVRIQNLFGNAFRKMHIPKFKDFEKKPMPLLYSNIPLSVPYVPMTKDLLERNERFVYGSVIYLCESSLVADSMSFKDQFVNEQLLLFNKLIAHETRGGYLFYDTQSISDNHFAIKRCLSSYFYIHHTIKVPFFCLMWVRELKFSEDGSAVNQFGTDVEDELKLILVPKRVWKLFDCYCYSALTDDLPVKQNIECAHSRKQLKARNIISFKDFKNLFGGNKHE